MGIFLNSKAPYEMYRKIVQSPYFVDKSLLLAELFSSFDSVNSCVCITRPRRFGKTVMANMIGAFFGGTERTESIFDKLLVAGSPGYEAHRNRHNVIFVDFSRVPKQCGCFEQYIGRIEDGILEELAAVYPDCGISGKDAVWDALLKVYERTDDQFLFVLDEWDAVFHMPFISETDQRQYLLFLKLLLKDQPYMELAYMTGVLPIAKYSSGSELNMFTEYDMATSERFGGYFGFSEAETDRLYDIYRRNTAALRFNRGDLREWYDGYYTAAGLRLYNPRSVVLALSDNQLRNYWTSAGPYDEIFYYIRNNIEDVREDLALMVSGECVSVNIGQFAAVSMEMNSREQIYSAMVVYGLLTYRNGAVLIPNRELMEQYQELLLSRDSLGYVYQLARKSELMLRATLAQDTKTMREIIQLAHNTETPILSYNNEAELSAIVNLCYLSARGEYRIEREDKAGKGFVDFIFYPMRENGDCILMELKADSTADFAIAQIKEKDYALRFLRNLDGKPLYTGRILAVGISYCKKTKEHECKVEILENPV